MKISSAPIPHFRKWPFPNGKPFLSKGKRIFLQNVGKTLSLICMKIELLCLKYLHLNDKGERLKLSGSEHKVYLEENIF